jgi:hypothetical protein
MHRITKTIVICSALLFISGLVSSADARSKARGRSWVPQAAWNAAKQRAKLDLGSGQIKLYKSGWSKRLSKGLRSSAQAGAYIVHAKLTEKHGPWPSKTKGVYLVEKSRQGIYEAFPVAPNSRQKHTSKVDARKGGSFDAYADGGFPPSKMVHGMKVKNAGIVGMQLGQIVASKQRGSKATVFVLPSPNKGGHGAAAQLRFTPRPPIFRQDPSRPGCIMPPPPSATKYANVQFSQLFYAQSQGAQASAAAK